MTPAVPVTRPGRDGAAVRPAESLVLSAWSAVSPFGTGAACYRDGLRADRGAVTDLDQEVFPGPYTRAGVVPDFSAAGALGRKGTRTMDRVTALAVSAFGNLLESCAPGLLDRPERVGLVLGTGSGSVQSIMDFTRDSLTGERPYLVDPARFPNTVMNRAAGQSAIWHGIKGPNTTVSAGWLTGLHVLGYAARLHRGGHCDRVLCGSAEEYSVQRAWLEWHAAGPGLRPPLAEGCAVWLMETDAAAREAGRTPLARLLGTRFRGCQEAEEAPAALSACVREALESVGASARDVRLVVPLGAGGEERTVLDALPGADPVRIGCRRLLGDASAAATAFQIVAVLARAEDRLWSDGALALVTGVDRDGTVGCALLGAGPGSGATG
ncbi:beta-ketoacyl synthase N-terminal-like domain-containing protein [Streptomyces sodiiphilus]|uniref:Beta-ketoacyl synthase N-terminal-like domain-containing protein n=1 Tax=Streptomyces sodiiphilus TaxID=226217 RepID=A0ABN2PRZ3_9ACTN